MRAYVSGSAGLVAGAGGKRSTEEAGALSSILSGLRQPKRTRSTTPSFSSTGSAGSPRPGDDGSGDEYYYVTCPSLAGFEMSIEASPSPRLKWALETVTSSG